MSTEDKKDFLKEVITKEGSFNRPPSTFRSTIEKGGQFEPEKGESCRYGYATMLCVYLLECNGCTGRYLLYVSYGCRTHPPVESGRQSAHLLR